MCKIAALFSFSLALFSQLDIDEYLECSGRELQRRVSWSEPQAAFRIADGAEKPGCSSCSLREAHGRGSVSTR